MRTNALPPLVLAFLFAGTLASTTAIAAEPNATIEAAPRHAASLPDAPDRTRHGDPAQYEVRDRPVTAQDLQVLMRAGEMLHDASAWNRSDDRQCEDDEAAGQRSLFCALQAASIEVLGAYDHRRVALQEVRFAIEQVTRGREFGHRLMEFNNLPETTLSDLHEVLGIAADRVAKRLQTNGVATP